MAKQQLARWWGYLQAMAARNVSEWQLSLLSRRKFTSPAEVTKMRKPATPATRATWYP